MADSPLRIGILSSAHLHVWSYVSALRNDPRATLVGVWDDDIPRGEVFAQETGLPFLGYLDDLLAACDAVVITSENHKHLPLATAAARAGKHILCEKPLVAREGDADTMRKEVAAGAGKFMTAFPCRFSPAYQRLKQRVQAGEIGRVRAIAATNRGTCPGSWFVQEELSGGGAMIDHVVHVTDLLRDLLGSDPILVQAQVGNNMYGQSWEDTAMLTLEFPEGIFATLDSSWSRPKTFKTWGDVTMTVTGDQGVVELDMFGAGIDHYHAGEKTHSLVGYGTNFDALMVGAFIEACLSGGEVPVTLEDGLLASQTALAGYRSCKSGEPTSL
jgi:predicted dehydrogenase